MCYLLFLGEFIVHSFTSLQLLMSPDFMDFPFMNHGDAVRILYGGQSMSNYDARPSRPGTIQGFLDHLQFISFIQPLN